MTKNRLLWWLCVVFSVSFRCRANFDAQKIVLAGFGDRARFGTEGLLERNGLDGTGQAVAIADTGLDFDHCMLWQEPFPFPCFDPTAWVGTAQCPATAFASLLALAPYREFVKLFIETDIDVFLFGASSAIDAGEVKPPLDSVYPGRADRIEQGYSFNMGNDTTIHLLLQAWGAVRPQLLQVLQDDSLCTTCGGSVESVNGTTNFVPNSPYFFEKQDETTSVAKSTIGKPWRVLQNLLFEKCFCFFTEESDATLDPTEPWKGLVPPLRILQEMAFSPTAAIARKSAGLTALDYSLLDSMCSTANGTAMASPGEDRSRDADGVATDLCRNMMTSWGGETLEWNTCELDWDARLIESTIGKCVGNVYLVKSPFDHTTRAGSRDLSEALPYVRSNHYTWDTTLAWWDEFTKVPPFNQVDKSRRVVQAYYTFDDKRLCEGSRRLRLDTRRYPKMHTSHKMPVHLHETELLSVHLEPEAGDWRFDQFEARYNPMEMQIQITVEMAMSEPRPLDGLYVCLNTNQSIASMLPTARTELSSWTDCLTITDDFGQSLSWTWTQIPNTRLVVLEMHGKVDPLPPSDAGWRVMMLNNETSEITATVVMQLYTKDLKCGDHKDTSSQLDANSHSIGLPHRHVAAEANAGVCEAEGLTYCDGSLDSGRQLDLCLVCGGSCFPPGCSAETCSRTNPHIPSIRHIADFRSGLVTKVYSLGFQSLPGGACPSPTGEGVVCRGVECSAFLECLRRAETYKIHTQHVTAAVGSQLRFGPSLLFEYSGFGRTIMLTVTCFRRPDLVLRARSPAGLEGGARVQYSPTSPDALNVTVTEVSEFQLTIVGNETTMADVLQNLTFSLPTSGGDALETRHLMIRFAVSVVGEDGGRAVYRDGELEDGCKPGLGGFGCSAVVHPTDIIVDVEPEQRGQRPVAVPAGVAGRRLTRNRGGHGTHIATSIVGKVQQDGASPPPPHVTKHQGIAPGALLAFVDIGAEGNAYLMPPVTIGAELMGKPYAELGVRVFLNAWTCADMLWWRKQGQDFDSAQRVPSSTELSRMPSVCNRYTEHAWQVDDFVEQHEDMLVIFPAGDSGADGSRTVASPGTCKNCLTVGMSQLWPDALEEASASALLQCRASDCPQEVDKSGACGAMEHTLPVHTPACCTAKYAREQYDADLVDPRSSRGPAVSEQGEWSVLHGDLYGDLAPLRFRRFKPEVVAPGVNIVSGRSDGDPNSHGTSGCRCCSGDPKGGLDTNCLTTLSGSAQAAAQVAGAALLVRQWFEAGYYPLGLQGVTPVGHNPSAALVKAMLVAGAEPMRGVVDRRELRDFTRIPKSAASEEAGYGAVRLDNVLRLAADAAGEHPQLEPQREAETGDCACNNSNAILMEVVPGALERFGADYGIGCKAWHLGAGSQSCGALYHGDPSERPAPLGAWEREFDRSCCMSWCFVKPSCPSAQPWKVAPGMFFSFRACADDVAEVASCSWQHREVFTVAKDHSIRALPRDDDAEPVAWVPAVLPQAGAITQGEEVTYVVYTRGASELHPLSIVMTYTDPPPPLGSKTVLVNDLDLVVVVTPLDIAADAALALNRTLDQFPLNRSRTRRFQGNDALEDGSDRYNNVERVFMDEMSGPSQVEVKVKATRVTRASSGSEGLCQTFALVITGQLDGELVTKPLSVSITPFPFRAGICGRAPVPPPPEDPLLKTVEIVAIVVGSVACALCIVLAVVCTIRFRTIAAFAAIEDRSAPKHAGYMSRVDKASELTGTAKGGGPDYISLGAEASVVDEAYTGLPIMLTSGPNQGEHATITAYDGKTKTAAAIFGNGPTAGTTYSIAHVGAEATGYLVGDGGYIPMVELPQATGNGMYSRQLKTLQGARRKVGKLAGQGLTALGVGRQPIPRTVRQEIEAVRAGMHVGKPVASGDLFIAQFDKTEEEKEKEARDREEGNLTPRSKAIRQHFLDQVYARNSARLTFGEDEEGIKGRNIIGPIKGTATKAAPPLKHKARPQGQRGFVKPARRNGAGAAVDDDDPEAVTWELETPRVFAGDMDHTEDEMGSGSGRIGVGGGWAGGGVLVTASLTPGKPAGASKAGSGKLSKLSAAEKAKLLDKAFGGT